MGPEKVAVLDEGERAAAEAGQRPGAVPEVVHRRRAQGAQQWRAVPDLVEALLAEAPRRHRVDAARKHVAVGRDHASAPSRAAQLLALLRQAPDRLVKLLGQHRVGQVGAQLLAAGRQRERGRVAVAARHQHRIEAEAGAQLLGESHEVVVVPGVEAHQRALDEDHDAALAQQAQRPERPRVGARDPRDRVVGLGYERGLLMLSCGKSVIRIAPPLSMSTSEMDEGLRLFEDALTAAEKEVK